MHTKKILPSSALLALLASITVPTVALSQTWSAPGDGNWSTGSNWTPASIPGSGNTATLNDTSSNRTVTYDSGASGTVGTLVIDQTTAGFTNTINLQRSLILQNALTLGASAGTEQVIVGSTAGGGFSLTSSNGTTLNSGGVLALSATTNTGGNGFQAGSTNANTAITIAGGTLLVQATTGNFTAGAASNTVNGILSMTDGIIRFDNIVGTASDRRLDIRGNVNISGGAITADRSTALLQFLSSANTTIALNPTTFESTKIGLNFQSNSTQAISSNQTLGAIAFRGTGVKTLTSTASGNGIGALTFWDTDSTTPSSATTLLLGSNLNLNSAANQPTVTISAGHTLESGRIDAAIDTNGFTLDLTAGASSGVWTPPATTQSGATNTVWTLSGNGSIRANALNLSTANVTTNVGTGLVLNAVGGNSTASNLGSVGSINSASTFRYSGSADAVNPATLTFARNIGQVTVTSGALRILSGASGTITGIAVPGGTLALQGASRSVGTLSLTGGTLSNGTYSLTSGNFTGLETGTVSGVLSGNSSLIKDSPGVLTLAGNNNFGSGGSVTVNQGTLAAGHVNAFGATALVIANGGAIDLGGLSINKWFNIGANGGSISNGTIARNTSNNATFAWQAGSVSASITEAGGGIVSINKTGNGTLTVSGNNAYSGTTTVAAGTLYVNGSHTGGGNYSVTGTLGGNGTLTPAATSSLTINSGGVIAPGASGGQVGTLTLDGVNASGNLATLASGAKLAFDLDGTLTTSDRLTVANGAAGDLVFNGNVIDFNPVGVLSNNQAFTLASASAADNYTGLTLDGSNKITDGLSIGTGLTGFGPSYLSLVGSNIVLTLVTDAPANALLAFRTANSLSSDGSQDLLAPAGDGVSNLLKYAFNMIGADVGQAATLSTPNSSVLAPAGSAGLPLIGVESGTGKLTLTYIRRKASASPAPGISYAVQFNSDLAVPAGWVVNPSATESVTSLDSTFERVLVTDSVTGASKRFTRVQVTALAP